MRGLRNSWGRFFYSVFLCVFTLSSSATLADNANCLSIQKNYQFRAPHISRLQVARAQLRQAMQVLDTNFQNAGQAARWKAFLEWKKLESSFSTDKPSMEDLKLVRSRFFHAQQPVDHPTFADVREKLDSYIAAAFTFTREDLEGEFYTELAKLQRYCSAYLRNPNSDNRREFSKSLDWFEKTQLLAYETNALIKVFSSSNMTLKMNNTLIQRAIPQENKAVLQTSPVTQTLYPPTGFRGRPKAVTVHGSSTLSGSVDVQLIENPNVAQIDLVLTGSVSSNTSGSQGPVTTYSHTGGAVGARMPLYVHPTAGIKPGRATASADVVPTVTGIEARRRFVRRIAARKASKPAVVEYMHRTANQSAKDKLQTEYSKTVSSQLEELLASMQNGNDTLEGFYDVTAAAIREGAVPELNKTSSTRSYIQMGVLQRKRGQISEIVPCSGALSSDVQLCFGESFFENFSDIMMGDKTYSDEDFQEWSKILVAELPLALTVHTRAKRWSAKFVERFPFAFDVLADNQIRVTLRLEAFTVEGKTTRTPIKVSTVYQAGTNEFSDIEFNRVGNPTYEIGELNAADASLLKQKFDAFFGPLINFGNILIPDGGLLGALNGIELKELKTDSRGWLVASLDVPDSVLKKIKEQAEKNQQGAK